MGGGQAISNFFGTETDSSSFPPDRMGSLRCRPFGDTSRTPSLVSGILVSKQLWRRLGMPFFGEVAAGWFRTGLLLPLLEELIVLMLLSNNAMRSIKDLEEADRYLGLIALREEDNDEEEVRVGLLLLLLVLRDTSLDADGWSPR